MTDERGRDGAVVLGLVAPSGMPRELADQIAEAAYRHHADARTEGNDDER